MTAYELAEQAESLAYEIPADWSSGKPKNVATDIANMLRQQADLIRNLQKTLGFLRSGYESINLTPQTKPLSDEEIWNWFKENTALTKESALRIARAIEERHGIK